MFRRKEEGLPDSQNDLAGMSSNPAQAASGGASGNENSQTNSIHSAPVSASVQTALHSQPSSPVARPVSDVARAPGSASSVYRPSPVAEFNRGMTQRPSQEVGRPVGSHGISSLNANNEKHKSSPRILTVGNDILLKGEIATCDRVVIEGRVEAKLNEVHTVEIASCGSFKGTAEVEDAEVSGLFEGDLVVRNRLVIYSSGEIRGNVTYGEIEIERGGKLMGQIKTVANAGTASAGDKPTLLDVLDIKSRALKDAAEG